MKLSGESLSISCNLTLPTLNSSTREAKGNCSILVLPYSATDDRQRGTLNHFRIKLFTCFSITSTFDNGMSYTINGHIIFGNKMCWKHQHLNFPPTAE